MRIDLESCHAPVRAGDHDEVLRLQVSQVVEDAQFPAPIDVADDDRRSHFAGCRATGAPTGRSPVRRHLQRPVVLESEVEQSGVDPDGRDPDADRRPFGQRNGSPKVGAVDTGGSGGSGSAVEATAFAEAGIGARAAIPVSPEQPTMNATITVNSAATAFAMGGRRRRAFARMTPLPRRLSDHQRSHAFDEEFIGAVMNGPTTSRRTVLPSPVSTGPTGT